MKSASVSQSGKHRSGSDKYAISASASGKQTDGEIASMVINSHLTNP